MSSTANRVIKNTGYLYAKMGITMFVSLYTTRLILNSLGASDFGIFDIVGGAIAMLGFLNAAMASATQRFMSYSEGEGDKEKQKSIFNVSLILHLGISLVVGIVLFIAGYFFFNGILNIPADRIFAAKVVYGSLIVSTMFTVMTVPYDAAMNAHENMKYYAVVGIFESFLKLAVAFACVYTTFDKLIVYGSLMACIPLITLTIMRIYCHRRYEECIIAPRAYWNRELMKKMTSFAGWSFSSNATSIISNYGLGIVLNMFFKTVLNAAQGIAGQITGQLIVFTSNMLKAVNPIIYKSAGAKNKRLSCDIAIIGCKFSFLITAFFTLPFIIETPYILKLWLKEVPEYAIIFTQLQIARTMIEQLTTPLGTSISATGFIKHFSIIRTILNLLPLPIIYVAFNMGAPPYAMYLISICIWSIIGGYINLFYAQKFHIVTIKRHLHEVILPCLITSIIILLAGFLIRSLFSESILRLGITILSTSTVYIIMLILVNLSKEEKTYIIEMWHNIRLKL